MYMCNILFTSKCSYLCIADAVRLEVCSNQAEPLDIACDRGQVILLNSASFGQMYLGRCLTSELEYMGCGNDVLHVVDGWCSGKRECHMPTPNIDLIAESTCSANYGRFLEVDYACISGKK